MKAYKTEQLRNVGLFSHGGAGKTTLSEAMLYNAGVINRLGRVSDGTTVSDYDPEEMRRQVSVQLSVLPIEWKGAKVTIVDTPGYADFVGEVHEAMRAVDSAIIVLDAVGVPDRVLAPQQHRSAGAQDHVGVVESRGHATSSWCSSSAPQRSSIARAKRSSRSRHVNAPNHTSSASSGSSPAQ